MTGIVILVLAGFLILAGIIAAVIILAVKSAPQKKKEEHPFEQIDLAAIAAEEKKLAQVRSRRPDPAELTRKLSPYPEMSLKAYVVRLVDLDRPNTIYQVNMGNRVVIGRRENCNLVIPDSTLSGLHCEIFLKDGRFFIHDLGSLNGTIVNGRPNRGEDEPLQSGSLLQMGIVKTRVFICVSSASQSGSVTQKLS